MARKQKQQDNLVSTINFCREVGINSPQQIYQMLQKGKVPQEIFVYQQVGTKVQPLFKLEEAKAWWLGRKAESESKRKMPAKNAAVILNKLIDMINQEKETNPEIKKLSELLEEIMNVETEADKEEGAE